MEATMIRPFLIAMLIAPLLSAQTPEQRLKDAWARYLQVDIPGSPDKKPQVGVADAMDELGRAWAAWVEWHGPNIAALPDPMSFQRSDEPDTLTPPASRILAYRGPWTLMGLEVPVPCGTHLFVALFKTKGPQWRLVMLDLHEPRTEHDSLGARENGQTLLLDGPKVVIASTPPWCTSCWSALQVRAFAPGSDPEHPRLLAHFEDSVYRCADDGAFEMTPVKEGVGLTYEGWGGPDKITRKHVRRLKVP